MGKNLENGFTRKEIRICNAIEKTKEDLCCPPEELEDLRCIYGEFTRTKDANNYFIKMQSSASGLDKFRLWKRFQNAVGENYDNNINYQEFTRKVLDLDRWEWERFWNSGNRVDTPYLKR